MNSRFKTIVTLGIAPGALFIFHIIVDFGLGLYSVIWWLDIPMHFLGGVTIAVSTSVLFTALQKERALGELHWQVKTLFTVCMVALAAVLWEFVEFAGDTLVYHQAHFQTGTADTMKDLCMGLLGGLVTALLLTRVLKKKTHA